MSPELLFFCSLGLLALGLAMRWGAQDEAHRDARHRNPRTWDDEA